MIKKIFKLQITIFILFILLSILKINNISKINNIKHTYNKQIVKKENIEKGNNEIIGYIQINKINLKQPLYDINSVNNTVEKNVEILNNTILPPNKNSIIFLAAHSGSSNISYFNNINKLNINDSIKININNINYIYIVKNIYKERKTGYINVNKEKLDQLILTTCDPNNDNYQLIINSTIKEFN